MPQLKPHTLREFHKALATWYEAHGRQDLPWRNTSDPYHIWVSEVMLQQTQVATVRDRYYSQFLAKFPNIGALANASEEAVLKAWEGLGYYSRARNLHRATIQVGKNLPKTLEQFMQLPGIGRNTASAILAFGFHAPVAILEANVKRVVARIFALKTPSDAELWQGAEMLLNTKNPFDYNQAMMDVGAIICTPKQPKCGMCPANTLCKGKTSPRDFPAPKTKKQTPTRRITIIVPHDSVGRIALEKRDEKLLGGLYGFAQQARDASLPKTATKVGNVKHVYSHFKVDAQVVMLPVAGGHNQLYSPKEIAKLPLSRLDHKVLALVSHHLVAK